MAVVVAVVAVGCRVAAGLAGLVVDRTALRLSAVVVVVVAAVAAGVLAAAVERLVVAVERI